MSPEIKREINAALELDYNLHQLKIQIKKNYGHNVELKFLRNLKEDLKKDPKSRNNLAEFVEILRKQHGK